MLSRAQESKIHPHTGISRDIASIVATLVVALVAALPSVAVAQFGQGWLKVPSIVVVGAADDPRQPLVDEAVAFWNQTLAELGSPFRLGSVTRHQGSVPGHELQRMSDQVVQTTRKVNLSLPDSILKIPGDLFVVLSDAEFVSFAGPFVANHRRMVAIRGLAFPPMNLPNVARNVLAHELGHAIGIGHNSDETSLMCGRPSPCRPALFRSEQPRMFPLTEQEKKDLIGMYPLSWAPNR